VLVRYIGEEQDMRRRADMPSVQDASLVVRLRLGEREAMQQVYQLYKADVLRLVAAMLADEHAAWDALHDVFVSLARNAPHLAPDTNLKAYLLTAGANRARDFLAKSAPVTLDCEKIGQTPSLANDDPSTLATEKEDTRRLWRRIASLPQEQRIVLALHIFGGLTFKEIAEREQAPENTVQSRYRYAIEKMRLMLQEEAANEDRK
jgi:RNA polymerase sigma-70 factor (ECF subfamily)